MTRPQRLMIATLVIAAAGLVLPTFSSATYTARTANTSTVSAAADWTPPTVSVQDPGAAVKGTTTITAAATDAQSGIQSVTIQQQPAAGGAWVTICTTTSSPFTCAWDTTAQADGAYLLRAIATDRAGYSSTSSTVSATVANQLTVALAAPPAFVSGTVPAVTTVSNAGALTPVVRVEYSTPGSSTWTSICSNLTSPYSCSVTTTSIANGTYDLRSVAVVGTLTATSPTVRSVVDNQAPTVTMTNPGSPLTGTKTFAATAADALSGVDRVVIQYATGSAWSTLCTVEAAPFSCSYDTSALPNGTYSFRAVATDKAGNSTTSTAVTGRTVTNIVSTVTLVDPGTYLRGTVTLQASATSTGTIASVKIQRSPAGAGTWTDICTDSSSPYTCSLTTTSLAAGSYDLRAVVTDSNGKVTPSPVLAGRVVDNTAPTGVDVQAVNGGTVGRIDEGDVLTFTYSEQVDLTTILPGWDGSATSVTGSLSAGFLSTDTLTFGRNGGTPRLGTIDLNADFMTVFSSSTVNATMTASSTTVGGIQRTVVTVRIDSGSSTRTATTAATMGWTPSTSVTDLAGNAITSGTVAETGTQDRDF